MVTEVIATTAAHPPLAAIVYVTVYVFGAEELGVIAPVAGLIVRPAVVEYTPPV